MSERDDCAGVALKQARLAAGLTQRELARRAGVHQPQVARLERGEDVQVSLLTRVAAPLGLVPGLVRLQAVDGSRDIVEANVDTWRVAWPQVDPQVFAILARLAQAGRHVEKAIERTAALHGMSGREVVVLGALRRSGPPYESTPTGLKHLLWLSLPGLKKRLDRLEALGMVTRASNPRDRRGLVVRLTPKGHAALEDLVTHPQAIVYRALLEMAPGDRSQLSASLRDLLVRLGSQQRA
ncbi:helix-turn-helix domain-containing protein [Piscinibacter sp. XHJ-5]|uniref:helix-turn-helix domain-containing protein n=1 Tax=Piscinibacter sp. XHJ-5 TaxID=3037797 RepID=UPI002452B084|nr:helix-turn-helix domain-containing protein [Piscinibacter sp. XHJ-5]